MHLQHALVVQCQPGLRRLRLCGSKRHRPAACLSGEQPHRTVVCRVAKGALLPASIGQHAIAASLSVIVLSALPIHPHLQIAEDGHVGRALAAASSAFRFLREAKHARGSSSRLFELPAV